MSVQGNYTALNLNLMASMFAGIGFRINPTAQSYMGTSTGISNFTPGSIYNGTLLKLKDVTSLAYSKIGSGLDESAYNALINIGANVCPILGNSKPASFNLVSYVGETTKYGWLRLPALLAHTELNPKPSSSITDFCNTFNLMESWRRKNNKIINSFAESKKYLSGSFSNMNDLITGDITGVNYSTFYWGRDLIKLGRSIDLSSIDTFGLPSNLLKTLYKNKANTPSLNVALLSAGFTEQQIYNILISNNVSISDEKTLYGAFSVIVGTDLQDICTLLNCQTEGLVSLSDLLNPEKMFPDSYKSLTYPVYNTFGGNANSKVYFLIYFVTGVTTWVNPNVGQRLREILPNSIAYACDAFSIAMMQIRNIKSLNIEKFSQVVANLENVIGVATGATNTPANPTLANIGLTTLAYGSGPNGSFLTSDFFGAMSGLGYEWPSLKSALNDIDTSNLLSIYADMETLLSGVGPYDAQMLVYINQANDEIENIKATYPDKVNKVNEIYEQFGVQVEKEYILRPSAIQDIANIESSIDDIYAFVDSISTYALDTQNKCASNVLEAIADLSYVGGQCLVASLREARNQARLGLCGISLDSGIPTDRTILPRVDGTTPLENPIENYTLPSDSPLNNTPVVTGAANIPGSFAGSPESGLIPYYLNIQNIPVTNSVLTPQEAIDEVIKCNCDCWENL